MKFYYIDNDLCSGCGSCESACPASAIFGAEGRRYINYDKCLACGACYHDCRAQAITLEKFEKLTVPPERFERYRSRIEKLEHDIVHLRGHLADMSGNFDVLIRKLPLAAFTADKYGRVISANDRFVGLAGPEARELSEEVPGLTGADLKAVLPEEVYRIYRRGMLGDDIENELSSMGGHTVSVSAYSISQGDITLCLLRNLSDPAVVNEEIADRLRRTIDRKMAMVQKIGFLLGEEVSEAVKSLNSVIEIVETPLNRTGKDAK